MQSTPDYSGENDFENAKYLCDFCCQKAKIDVYLNYTIASFSNYGDSVDVAAPGVDIWSYAGYTGAANHPNSPVDGPDIWQGNNRRK